MLNRAVLPLLFFYLTLACHSSKDASRSMQVSTDSFVVVADENPAYFELSDHTPYIPIGLNLISPGGARDNEQKGLAEVEAWMKALSENGGNYVRIWLSNSFWDIENQHAGVYDEAQARRIDKFLGLARKYGLHVKMTLEHFRALTPVRVHNHGR